MGTELDDIRKELAELRMDVKLCINYMRELAVIIGARERLAALDRELADQERRDTDMLPPENGDTQP